MRKQPKFRWVIGGAMGLILAASPFIQNASAEEDGRVYYKQGTRLEFEDFDMKINIQLQPFYSFTDRSQKDRAAVGLDPGTDVSNFDIRRGRLGLTGNVLDKQFSYKFWNDFAASNGSGKTVYVWMQWNGAPELKIRMGQDKVPYTRQFRVSSAKLFFVNSSRVNDTFRLGFDTGVQALGTLGGINYYTGLFNGNSTGEGRGTEGLDNKVNWAFAADVSTDNYGSRGVEGDFREDSDLGATLGYSMFYGQGEDTADLNSDFDQIGVNIDAGIRICGFDLQGEVYWQERDYDDVASVDGGNPEANGFYLAAAYNFNKKWGAGYRYGFINPDSDNSDVFDDRQEHSVVLNYYFMGHFLKLQNGFTWELNEVVADGDDINDFRYEIQLAALF